MNAWNDAVEYWDEKSQLFYVRQSDCPSEWQKEFAEWLIGQTRPLIDALGDEQDAVFAGDWDRFVALKNGKNIGWD